MKYWRGYLVAAILALFSFGLIQFAQSHSVLIDMVYPYVSRTLQEYLTNWTGSMAACVWQVVLVLFGVGLLASIVLMVVLRWNPVQWLGWVAAVVSLVFLLHTGVYGLNEYAGPLAEDIRLTVTPYTLDQLSDATTFFRDMANVFSEQVDRDENGVPAYGDFDTLAKQAAGGFHSLTYDHYYSVFAYPLNPVKELGWSNLFTGMGITGLTVPLTGEAAVNPQTPTVALPYTMCREMAYRMCISTAKDANMAAYLACYANPLPEFQYAGYFMAYRYCYLTLESLDASAAQAVAQDAGELLNRDLKFYEAFFTDREDQQATEVANLLTEAYENAKGDALTDYGSITDLLVSWHIQEIILPSLVVEEDPFDPMDENQVDLSGLVDED